MIICLRLVTPELEGAWMQIAEGRTPQFLVYGMETVTMVPTGAVEWSGQQCAEVWVPESKLNLWKMEHAIDADAR